MRKNVMNLVIVFVAVVLLEGCATVPFGPTVMVMPAPGKPFQMFQQEQEECQKWALQQIGGQQKVDEANQAAVANAVVGGIVGTAVGVLLGAGARHAGNIAAAGAGAGLVVGAASGANASAGSAAALQHLYDVSFIQCMYSKGNQVPRMVQ